jgi:hypothetical protein
MIALLCEERPVLITVLKVVYSGVGLVRSVVGCSGLNAISLSESHKMKS